MKTSSKPLRRVSNLLSRSSNKSELEQPSQILVVSNEARRNILSVLDLGCIRLPTSNPYPRSSIKFASQSRRHMSPVLCSANACISFCQTATKIHDSFDIHRFLDVWQKWGMKSPEEICRSCWDRPRVALESLSFYMCIWIVQIVQLSTEAL